MTPAVVYALAAFWVACIALMVAIGKAVADGQRPIHDIVRDAERRTARSRR